jgi:nucleoid-associated protein YgaU
MVSLPINFLGREFAEAILEFVQPQKAAGDKTTGTTTTIKLHYNPPELKLSKQNAFAEIPIPGLGSPPLQFTRGGSRTLSMDLLTDTSDDPSVSVREKYVQHIENAMAIEGKLHAPPVVRFHWAENQFTGVISALDVNYVLFHHTGVPLRARLAMKMTEYKTIKDQVADPHRTSPDVEKRYVVRIGETLSSISAAVYQDPAHWREIAVANGIIDPRFVAPGTVLTVPPLTGSAG